MKTKSLFILAAIGIGSGILSIYVYNTKIKLQAPISISYNPYRHGVYATGIIESYQATDSNVNVYPEVSGRITRIFVRDGQLVRKGDLLFIVNDAVQKEVVQKDIAQINYEQANLTNVQQQLDKIKKSYEIDPRSVSLIALDNAKNSVLIAKQNVQVAMKQYYSDYALWAKYFVRSPIDGKIFRIVAAVGDYAAPEGTYDTYTQLYFPVLQIGVTNPYLAVRCYLNEILVPSLPPAERFEAKMFIRGGNSKPVVLEFMYLQPYTQPKIQLSDQRQERVDIRVLPIVFRFKKPNEMRVYPGQLVDIYIKSK